MASRSDGVAHITLRKDGADSKLPGHQEAFFLSEMNGTPNS
ncbi:MAG: hypothetical protein QM758_13285 [Armatimonas sp.]